MKQNYLEEAEPSYTMTTVMEEAARCLLCHDAPCSAHCPADTDPAKFIRSVRFRNFKGAAETIRENNALGAVCARVCPTEKYCQLGCSRTQIDRPIDIGGIQKFVTDFESDTQMTILEKGTANGKKVAIVGSGPAGLQAAATLLQKGFAVDLYEQNQKAGGYLRYGIPEYRLPNAIVDLEVKRIEALGAEFHYGITIGKDLALAELKKLYDAVLLDIGMSEAKMLPMFENNPNVETAVSFLARVKESGGNVQVPENVVVVGGGDVAMDVDTTLKLLGAKNVTDVVYEEFSEFKASEKELAGARAAGITIIDGYIPAKVAGNQVTFTHRHIASELTITADKIILAIGQKPVAENLDLPLVHDEAAFAGYQSPDKQLFVTGDIAQGDKTVVWAVKKGKEAAEEIAEMLGGSSND